MKCKRVRLSDDRRGITEIVGMLLSITLTVLIFSVLTASVLMFTDLNPVANVVLQGTFYDGGDGIVLLHAGGDALPSSALYARVFINNTEVYEPNITLLSSDYAPDDDVAWELGDKLLLSLNVSAGSSAEVMLIDTRYDNVIGRIIMERL